jgi:hypothetical protein
MTRHLVKLYFECPSKPPKPAKEYGWFVSAPNVERIISTSIESLAYRCHPNNEFQRGFEKCVRTVGQTGFPPEIDPRVVNGAIQWTRQGPSTPHPEMSLFYSPLRQFARAHLKWEFRNTGTLESHTADIESIVWLVGRTKSRDAPVICNAFAHDNFTGAPSAGEIEVDWAWRHPIVRERESRLHQMIEAATACLDPQVAPYAEWVTSM